MDFSSLERVMKNLERLIKELERLTKESESFVNPLRRASKQLRALINKQKMDLSILERLAKQFERVVKQFERLPKQFGRLFKQFERLAKQFGRLFKQFERLAKQFGRLVKQFERLATQFDRVFKQFERLAKQFERLVKRFERLVKRFERLFKQLEGGRINHYSRSQKILLVGEGDFSFALCLARAFGSADNMVATSLDSKGSLMMNYSKAMTNLLELEGRECKIFHEVDARVMRYHPNLFFMRFDRIIYNFPHAGYMDGSSSSERNATQIWFHKNLVRRFFISAREMLTTDGEIHVTHKTTYPFSEWKLVKIAEDVGLYLVAEERFSLFDNPGYENKRGAGICDQTFPVGMSSTFRFAKNYLYC
ncbi:uncharacterized protein At4g26485-like [Rosa rugosa]|uniref:uncharacterized protein At4g26485-like n=1 Tax=Rosa rugosa TaxID=74645 RepID=UPI002B410151|nr:uncharacterized protein At4g26485-like [Rosa rugosa]